MPRLTVLTGAPRPAGLERQVMGRRPGRGEAGDADFILLPTPISCISRASRALVAQAERTGCDLVSEMVALRRDSLAERALVPAFVFFSSCSIHSPGQRLAARYRGGGRRHDPSAP